MTNTIPRVNRSLIGDVMFLRPRQPADHREFEQLLPQCTPVLVYADAAGRDWVRWAIPKPVAQRYGLDQGCACCGKQEGGETEHARLVDTAYDEVDWYLNRAEAGK